MILMTGGSGRLGQELQKYLDVYAPSHKEFDITGDLPKKKFDLIIHSAAYTNVSLAEYERGTCYVNNVYGTFNLIRSYPDTPFVYISSEYAKRPVNVYSQTKAIAEKLVEQMAKHHLILRTLFKPRPFPWDRAFTDQYTQGDYLDVIAPKIAQEIKRWNRQDPRLLYVGTGRKTMYELAIQTNPSVVPCSLQDFDDVRLPKDYL